jgi:signal peptidase I
LWGAVLVVAAVALLRVYVAASYRISTEAMDTALRQGEYVVALRGAGHIHRGDVLFFHAPGKRALLTARCIGLPGDTLRVGATDFSADGQTYPLPPTSLLSYSFSVENANELRLQLDRLNIPARKWQGEGEELFLRLTPFEAWRLKEEQPGLINPPASKPYTLVVPAKAYWLLADNPQAGADSRHFGPIPRKDIVGRLWFKLFHFGN